MTFLLPLVALIGAPSLAYAETTETSIACSLPEPSFSSDKPAPHGLSLGEIVEQQLGSHGAFVATVEPTVQLDLGRDEEIVNLTRSRSSTSLVFAPSRDGYRTLEGRRIEGGLGARFAFEFGNTTFLSQSLFAYVGLLPLAGREVVAERFFADRRALGARKNVPLPSAAAAALEQLRPHDALDYVTTGGLVFWAGAGFGIAGGVSLSALAQGDFQIHVEKTDTDHVYVKISEGELKSLGLQAGNGLVNASVEDFSRHARYLGFHINYRDPLGARAFHDLVQGNAAPVQKLAAEGRSQAVRFLDEGQLKRGGASSGFVAQIPLLFKIRWTTSRYSEVQRRRFYSCDRTLTATYGTFFKEREGSALGVRQKLTRAFYGASYALRNKADQVVSRGFFGQLVWNHRARNVLPETLGKAMEELASGTGLGRQVVLGIPAPSGQRLPYASLSLRVQFGPAHTLSLLNRARAAGQDRLTASARRLAERAFASGTSTDLCRSLTEDNAGRPCAEEALSRIDQGVDRMVTSLTAMDRALAAGNEKLATRAFAGFGEAMLSSPFLFQTGLELAGAGLPVDYVVEGSDFHRFTGTAKLAGGRLQPDSRTPLFRPELAREGLETISVMPLQAAEMFP